MTVMNRRERRAEAKRRGVKWQDVQAATMEAPTYVAPTYRGSLSGGAAGDASLQVLGVPVLGADTPQAGDTPTEVATPGRAKCPDCKTSQKLTKAGLLCSHKPSKNADWNCSGSGKPYV